MGTTADRHVFVTFWLKFVIVANITAIIFILTCVWSGLIWFYATDENARLFFFIQHNIVYYYEYGMIVNIAAMTINAVSAVLILKRRKCGFWIYLISNAIIVAVMALYAHWGGATSAVVLSMVGAILSPVILYAVAQIKKDGVQYWEQLK